MNFWGFKKGFYFLKNVFLLNCYFNTEIIKDMITLEMEMKLTCIVWDDLEN